MPTGFSIGEIPSVVFVGCRRAGKVAGWRRLTGLDGSGEQRLECGVAIATLPDAGVVDRGRDASAEALRHLSGRAMALVFHATVGDEASPLDRRIDRDDGGEAYGQTVEQRLVQKIEKEGMPTE